MDLNEYLKIKAKREKNSQKEIELKLSKYGIKFFLYINLKLYILIIIQN